ncbi:MAG: beta-lactamase family protein [Gammaproteobacteria bacterium]|nr:beta-lactamase family protein [Gammaproteobacteria bacterium]
MARGGAAVLLALLCSGMATTAAAQDSAAVDGLVTEAMAAQEIPAITVALMVEGRLVYSRAFGRADLENDVRATPETLIRTASIAKSLTAVAAMTLVDVGRLDLDAPVQRYCAPFPPKQWPVTTRELLSHTAGIRHYQEGEPEHTQHYRFIADGFTLFANDPLLFRPGTAYQYSTYGYSVVGCVIEGAAGMPFAEYLSTHVLQPAGMSHTRVDDAYDIVPHRARGYQKVEGQVRNAVLMDSSYKIPGGGYVSTAEDLVRFGTALLQGRLLKPTLVRTLWAPTPMSAGRYGLGFEVLEGGRFIRHTGGQSGTTTQLLLLPAQQAALAIMANMNDVQLGELARGILQQMQLPAPAAKP